MARSKKEKTEDTSYIPLNRKFFDSSFWQEKREFSKAEAWIDLVQSARYQDNVGKKFNKKGDEIKWKRGEFPASIRFLMKRWGWSMGKVTRFLDYCKAEVMITIRIEGDQNIITLVNYEKHNKSKSAESRASKGMNGGRSKDEKKPEHQPEHQNTPPVRIVHDSRNAEWNDRGTIAEQSRNKTEIKKIKEEKEVYKKDFAAAALDRELYKKMDKDKKSIHDFIKQYKPDFIEPYAELWNLFAKEKGFYKVRELNQYRMDLLSERLAEPDFDIVEILKKAAVSTFLKGKTWFTFDWVLKLDKHECRNYIKILEGKYDDSSGTGKPSSANSMLQQDLERLEKKKRA